MSAVENYGTTHSRSLSSNIYLLKKKFILKTGHRSLLAFVVESIKEFLRLQRWAAYLARYNYTIQHEREK